jgi:hypothetical protein
MPEDMRCMGGLGAFAELLNATPSVRVQKLGFRWTNFDELFSKICPENSRFIKI